MSDVLLARRAMTSVYIFRNRDIRTIPLAPACAPSRCAPCVDCVCDGREYVGRVASAPNDAGRHKPRAGVLFRRSKREKPTSGKLGKTVDSDDVRGRVASGWRARRLRELTYASAIASRFHSLAPA